MAKPHSHSTSWRYACHRPINDTTPVIRPSESHNPNRPTNRPTNCASGSILCRSASNERNVPVVHRSSQRDRGAFPPFRPNGYSERIIARLYIRIIITHAPIPSSPPDRLLFRSTEPADLQRRPTSTCRARDPKECFIRRVGTRTAISTFRTCEGSERRFQVLQSHIIFSSLLHCLLEVALRSYHDPSSAPPI